MRSPSLRSPRSRSRLGGPWTDEEFLPCANGLIFQIPSGRATPLRRPSASRAPSKRSPRTMADGDGDRFRRSKSAAARRLGEFACVVSILAEGLERERARAIRLQGNKRTTAPCSATPSTKLHHERNRVFVS